MSSDEQPQQDTDEASFKEARLARGPSDSWGPDLSNPTWQGDAPVEYEAEERQAIHDRWIMQLRDDLPVGVPLSVERSDEWPSTWGSELPDGTFRHHPVSEDQCLQCLFCRHYIELATSLGMDWGACTNNLSQYDRQVVFEHWTCAAYTPKADTDKRA